jgi:hypothetical protein
MSTLPNHPSLATKLSIYVKFQAFMMFHHVCILSHITTGACLEVLKPVGDQHLDQTHTWEGRPEQDRSFGFNMSSTKPTIMSLLEWARYWFR